MVQDQLSKINIKKAIPITHKQEHTIGSKRQNYRLSGDRELMTSRHKSKIKKKTDSQTTKDKKKNTLKGEYIESCVIPPLRVLLNF